MSENGNGSKAPLVQLSTLEDLSAPIINLRIDTAYGKKGIVSLGLLTYHEWFSLVDDIALPAIPHTRVNKAGDKIPNPQDADYVAAFNEAIRRQNSRRLAYALAKGGMKVEGNTADERAAYVARIMSADIVAALIGYLNAAVLGGRAAIEAQAETFQPVPNGAQPDHAAQTVDAGDVE